MNDSTRTTGIILVILTILLCACPGLVMLLSGGFFAVFSSIPGADIESDISPLVFGGISICLGIFLIAIPIVIAILTLRSKPRPTAPAAATREPVSAPPGPPAVVEPPAPIVETASEPAGVPAEAETVEPGVEEATAEPAQTPEEAPAEEPPDVPEEDENYIPPAI